MPLVKKILESWHPVEERSLGHSLEVGDIIYISDPRELLKSGACVLVDESGKEIPQISEMVCPVCNYKTNDLGDYQKHLTIHITATSGVMFEGQPKLEVEPESKKTFVCKICGESFEKVILLAIHTHKTHGSKNKSK